MSRLQDRLLRLEAANAPVANPIWHRVLQMPDQSRDNALDAYGRHRIGAEDGIIIRKIIFVKPEGLVG